MDGEKVCPTCGRLNPSPSRYCGNCGQMLAAAAILQPPAGAAAAERVAAAPVRLAAVRPIGLDPAACGVLSFFFPGVGHLLCGQALRGIWIIVGAFLIVRYLHVAPFGIWMVLARLWAALEAYRLAKPARREDGFDAPDRL